MYIKVRVRANARRERLEAVSSASLKISVREKAEGNAANRRVAELVALHFNVPARSVRIVSGHRFPSKLFSVPVPVLGSDREPRKAKRPRRKAGALAQVLVRRPG